MNKLRSDYPAATSGGPYSQSKGHPLFLYPGLIPICSPDARRWDATCGTIQMPASKVRAQVPTTTLMYTAEIA